MILKIHHHGNIIAIDLNQVVMVYFYREDKILSIALRNSMQLNFHFNDELIGVQKQDCIVTYMARSRDCDHTLVTEMIVPDFDRMLEKKEHKEGRQCSET